MTDVTSIELNQEDRATLNALLAVCTEIYKLLLVVHPAKSADASVTTAAPAASTPTAAPATPKSAAAPAAPATREQLQKRVIELCGAGKKAAAREVIKAYGAKVSDIAADVIPEVLQKLEAI